MTEIAAEIPVLKDINKAWYVRNDARELMATFEMHPKGSRGRLPVYYLN